MPAHRFLAAAALCLIGVAVPVRGADPPMQTSLLAVKPRVPAPDLKLEELDGMTVTLSRLKGKVVLVNFWATWCPPCRREFPSMERLRLILDRKPLVILAVNEGESADTIEGFTSQLDLAPLFPILLDREGAAMAAWPVRGLPTTYVIDKHGRIAYRAIGGREFDHPDIVKNLEKLLQEQ